MVFPPFAAMPAIHPYDIPSCPQLPRDVFHTVVLLMPSI